VRLFTLFTLIRLDYTAQFFPYQECNVENNTHNSKEDQNSSISIADDPQWKEWVVLHPQKWYTIRPESSTSTQTGVHLLDILQKQLHIH